MKRFLIFFIFISPLFGGCVTQGTERIKNTALINTIASSERNTESEITKIYGKPYAVYNKNGLKVYEYNFAKVRPNFVNMVPIASFFAKSRFFFEADYLFVYFDEQGIIKDYKFFQTEGEPKQLP